MEVKSEVVGGQHFFLLDWFDKIHIFSIVSFDEYFYLDSLYRLLVWI